jgi:hypothetical protein
VQKAPLRHHSAAKVSNSTVVPSKVNVARWAGSSNQKGAPVDSRGAKTPIYCAK